MSEILVEVDASHRIDYRPDSQSRPRHAAQRAAEDDVMTRDELVRELERLYAETEEPALFAGSLISYAAHVVRSCGGTCDMWMHATRGAFETAIKTWDKCKLPTFDALRVSNGSSN
jgi:hypothetical protein